GSAGLLVQTIKDNFDIDVNHYVQVDLAGFQNLVDQVGGVPIYFPTPVRDLYSGLLVKEAGCTTLDQNGALSYVRSRHFQYKNAKGKWRGDGASDYGRITRQQDFVRRVIRRVFSQGARNPVKLGEMVGTGIDHIQLDPYTKPADLITLGKAFKSFDPEKLQTHALVVREIRRGGADVLELVADESEPTLALFRGTGATGVNAAVDPSTITVRVINGTGKQDQASNLTDLFDAAGFKVTNPDSDSPVWRTEVRYRPGDEAEAVLVARYIDGDPLLVPDADARQITVVSGPDLVTVLAKPRPASAVTTTSTSSTTSTSTTSTTRPKADAESTTSGTSIPLAGGTGVDGEAAGYLPGDPPPGVSCG
ncbi:MAG: LCP family protein, partial [Aquihabitans sp.]